MPPRPKDGRNRPRLPSNLVYRTIQATGGPTTVMLQLGVSSATLKRWRRVGVVSDAAGVLRWAALLHSEPAAQLALARQLAGLPRTRSTPAGP